MRNPLADPGLLGITGTAGLGAVIAFYWGLAAAFRAGAAGWAACSGPASAPRFLLGFAGRAPSGPSLILAGVAVSAIAAALLALALTLAPNPFALAEITFWLMGGLADRPLWQVALAAPPILLGAAILLSLGRGLDALSLGEDTARSLGVPVARTLRLAAVGTRVRSRRRRRGRRVRSASSAWWCRICCARGSASAPARCCPPRRWPALPCC